MAQRAPHRCVMPTGPMLFRIRRLTPHFAELFVQQRNSKYVDVLVSWNIPSPPGGMSSGVLK